MLKRHDDQILLSDLLLEDISVEAQLRMHLRKPPIDGNFLVDMTVRAAESHLGSTAGPRQQVVPFFTGLNQTMYYTLCHITEQAGLGRREPGKFRRDEKFWGKFCEGAVDIKIKEGSNIPKIQRALFKVCHKLVKEHFEREHPQNARFADLVAYFLFNFWNAIGLLPMTQAMVNLAAMPS